MYSAFTWKIELASTRKVSFVSPAIAGYVFTSPTSPEKTVSVLSSPAFHGEVLSPSEEPRPSCGRYFALLSNELSGAASAGTLTSVVSPADCGTNLKVVGSLGEYSISNLSKSYFHALPSVAHLLSPEEPPAVSKMI